MKTVSSQAMFKQSWNIQAYKCLRLVWVTVVLKLGCKINAFAIVACICNPIDRGNPSTGDGESLNGFWRRFVSGVCLGPDYCRAPSNFSSVASRDLISCITVWSENLEVSDVVIVISYSDKFSIDSGKVTPSSTWWGLLGLSESAQIVSKSVFSKKQAVSLLVAIAQVTWNVDMCLELVNFVAIQGHSPVHKQILVTVMVRKR